MRSWTARRIWKPPRLRRWGRKGAHPMSSRMERRRRGSAGPMRPECASGRREGGIEVVPMGIVLLDQIDLPVAPPSLELLFEGDRLGDLSEFQPSDQTIHAVALGETGDILAFMLSGSSDEIVRHADIERAVASAGQHVDEVGHPIALLWSIVGRNAPHPWRARASMGPAQALRALRDDTGCAMSYLPVPRFRPPPSPARRAAPGRAPDPSGR